MRLIEPLLVFATVVVVIVLYSVFALLRNGGGDFWRDFPKCGLMAVPYAFLATLIYTALRIVVHMQITTFFR